MNLDQFDNSDIKYILLAFGLIYFSAFQIQR